MFLVITTAVAVFLGLVKALALLIGAIFGFMLFALLAGGLLTLLVKSLIDGIVQGWHAQN